MIRSNGLLSFNSSMNGAIILETVQHSICVNFVKSLPAKCIHYTLESCPYYLGITFLVNLSALKLCAVIKAIEWLKKYYLPIWESYFIIPKVQDPSPSARQSRN